MTQIEMIKNQLIATGEVSRNWCLQRYCSRLGARIGDLEEEGWVFKPIKREGDYVYKLVSRPQVKLDNIYSEKFIKMKAKKQISLI